jgi:hypothetical protein
MIEMQNPYMMPLNPDLTMFTENLKECTNNIIGYHHTFELNM